MAGRPAENVTLITSLPPEQLDAARWLARHRQHWGIENGRHARLDVSRRDEEGRLQHRNAVWGHGIFARLANSLFLEWRGRQKKPRHKTTTDLAACMAAEHARPRVGFVTARRPSLKTLS